MLRKTAAEQLFYVARHEQEQEAAAKRSFATAGIIVDERLTKLRFVMLSIGIIVDERLTKLRFVMLSIMTFSS